MDTYGYILIHIDTSTHTFIYTSIHTTKHRTIHATIYVTIYITIRTTMSMHLFVYWLEQAVQYIYDQINPKSIESCETGLDHLYNDL